MLRGVRSASDVTVRLDEAIIETTAGLALPLVQVNPHLRR